MVFGREFHKVGPETENDLEAKVCLLVHRTANDL